MKGEVEVDRKLPLNLLTLERGTGLTYPDTTTERGVAVTEPRGGTCSREIHTFAWGWACRWVYCMYVLYEVEQC
jgi:hypothetical protein